MCSTELKVLSNWAALCLLVAAVVYAIHEHRAAHENTPSILPPSVLPTPTVSLADCPGCGSTEGSFIWLAVDQDAYAAESEVEGNDEFGGARITVYDDDDDEEYADIDDDDDDDAGGLVFSDATREYMVLHSDGRLELKVPADQAAREFIELVRKLWPTVCETDKELP